MREGNHARSKHPVDPLEVAQESDKHRLEEEGEYDWAAAHTLLNKGQRLCLAYDQVGPLDDQHGNEVAALRVVKGLRRVADLILRDVGDLPKLRRPIVRPPTALTPIISRALPEK